MPFCAKCQRSFDGDTCPFCGSGAESSPESARRVGWYAILPLAGFMGAMLTAVKYEFVERTPIILACSFIFLIAVLPGSLYRGSRRPPPESQAQLIKKFYTRVGSVLVAVALLLFANCALDAKPPARFEVRIVSKHSQSGSRGGETYYLTVAPPWRSGKTNEEIQVSLTDYVAYRVGETVVIEVHGGLFHVPWYGAISRPHS